MRDTAIVGNGEVSFPRMRQPISTIGAFAPSDPVNESRLSRLRQLEAILAAQDVRVHYALHALAQPKRGRVAAQLRAADLHEATSHGGIDVAVSICGGKTCEELLPFVDFEALRNKSVPIFGFSNACILLNAITTKSQLVTFYGPESLNRLVLSPRFVQQLLDTDQWTAVVQGPAYVPITPGVATGRLFGGNLSSFVEGILGTEYEPRWPDRIFFWEAGSGDLDQIEGLLERLLQHDFSGSIRGMLVGVVADVSQEDMVARLSPVLKRFDVPVLYLPVFGHFREANPILPIGAIAFLDATRGSLTIATR